MLSALESDAQLQEAFAFLADPPAWGHVPFQGPVLRSLVSARLADFTWRLVAVPK